jgi:hypothetical protein
MILGLFFEFILIFLCVLIAVLYTYKRYRNIDAIYESLNEIRRKLKC